MLRHKDLTGQRFGKLVVQELAGVSAGQSKLAKWKCVCDCGGTAVVFGTALRRKNGTDNCGCETARKIGRHQVRHGLTNSPTYLSWKSMIGRCTNPENPSYSEYGGRGITVCDRWLRFEPFREDMGDRPEGMSLDRIDGGKGYEPANCKWSTPVEQARNRSSTIFVDFRGQRMSRREFARTIGISSSCVRFWTKKGMAPEQIADRFKLEEI